MPARTAAVPSSASAGTESASAVPAGLDVMLARTREATAPARMQAGDVILSHADADGQPVTFSYKVTERKPSTVTIRMIRFDGTLGEEKKYRVKQDDNGTEYVKLSNYSQARLG